MVQFPIEDAPAHTGGGFDVILPDFDRPGSDGRIRFDAPTGKYTLSHMPTSGLTPAQIETLAAALTQAREHQRSAGL